VKCPICSVMMVVRAWWQKDRTQHYHWLCPGCHHKEEESIEL